MNHRRRRDWGWLLYAVGSVLSVALLLVVLCGCKAAEPEPDTVRKGSHPCRCGERQVLR